MLNPIEKFKTRGQFCTLIDLSITEILFYNTVLILVRILSSQTLHMHTLYSQFTNDMQ